MRRMRSSGKVVAVVGVVVVVVVVVKRATVTVCSRYRSGQ